MHSLRECTPCGDYIYNVVRIKQKQSPGIRPVLSNIVNTHSYLVCCSSDKSYVNVANFKYFSE